MYTIFETFVGAGGSHLGFKNNGFISKYVNDIDNNCLKTLLYNNPDIKKTAYVDNSDIMDIDENTILDKIKMKPKELDVMFGGIVCKGFSLAGERSPNDPRNYFYRKQLKLVEKIKEYANTRLEVSKSIIVHDLISRKDEIMGKDEQSEKSN